MLELIVPITAEMWDESKEEFIPPETITLELEHSLVSLKEWESKWCKPFLSTQEKTIEETLDYIKCMTLTPNVDPNVYFYLTDENIEQINNYIIAPMTATTFSDEQSNKRNSEKITAELIYHWMITFGIPLECDKWHINSLLTLIRVRNIKTSPPKKLSEAERLQRNAELNAERRKRLNSKG